MNKILTILAIAGTIFLGSNANAANHDAKNAKISKVSDVQNMADDSTVYIQGYLVQNLGDEMYVFQDDSGKINIEIDDDLIEQIAMHTLENGDLRVGINLLRSCGNIAEADASREVTQDHFERAMDSLVSINILETIGSLNNLERFLLKLIAENEDTATVGELVELFKAKSGSSYASFNRSLDKLEFVRLVDVRHTGKGVKGNSREIVLRFNPDEYLL